MSKLSAREAGSCACHLYEAENQGLALEAASTAGPSASNARRSKGWRTRDGPEGIQVGPYEFDYWEVI